MEKERKLRKQMCHLNVEIQWLLNVVKLNGGDIEEELERMKKELDDEKVKMKELDAEE